jgi:serine/threonine-protein kinase RsbT
MSPHYQRVISVLLRYLSPSTVDAVMRRALRDANVSSELLGPANMASVIPNLERGIRLFVAPDKQEQLRSDLMMLSSKVLKVPQRQTVAVLLEEHISDARMLARGMCAEVGARTIVAQKAATIVSELARNIVSYTPGGAIELAIIEGPPKRLRIKATDQGKGIPNLDLVLSGNYKSRTGLGKGVLGVKRLADDFDLKTGASGTTVDVSVSL